MQLVLSRTIVLILLACVVQGARIKKRAQKVNVEKVAKAKESGEAKASAEKISAYTAEESNQEMEFAPDCCYRDCCAGRPNKQDRCIRQLGICHRNGGHHDHNRHGKGHHDHNRHGKGHNDHHRHGNGHHSYQGHNDQHNYQVGGWNNGGNNNDGWNLNNLAGGWNNGGNNNGWNLNNLFNGKKKHEVCCMCERHVGQSRTEWFPGEDYTVGQNAQGRCNRECAAHCRNKGADFAGCWREARMKTLRHQARSHPDWTIQGMPDDWFGDHPNDIC